MKNLPDDFKEVLVENTLSTERFRLAVVATTPELLAAYKELLAKDIEADTKALEYKLRDMDMAEAERQQKMQEKDKKKQRFSTDNSL